MHHVFDGKENYNYMVIPRVSRNISFCKSLWMMYNLFPGGVLHQQFSTMGSWFFDGCSPHVMEMIYKMRIPREYQEPLTIPPISTKRTSTSHLIKL